MADLTPEELKEIAKAGEVLEELENSLKRITLGSVHVFDVDTGIQLGVLVTSDDARLFNPSQN